MGWAFIGPEVQSPVRWGQHHALHVPRVLGLLAWGVEGWPRGQKVEETTWSQHHSDVQTLAPTLPGRTLRLRPMGVSQ